MKTVHDKVKDFCCNFCNFKASRVSNLKGHINAIHLKVKYYSCPFCEEHKSRTNYFTKHLRQKHGYELHRYGVSADMVRYAVGLAYRRKHKLVSPKKPKNYTEEEMRAVVDILESMA